MKLFELGKHYYVAKGGLVKISQQGELFEKEYVYFTPFIHTPFCGTSIFVVLRTEFTTEWLCTYCFAENLNMDGVTMDYIERRER